MEEGGTSIVDERFAMRWMEEGIWRSCDSRGCDLRKRYSNSPSLPLLDTYSENSQWEQVRT
ncbi:hypothetical protein M413DRAFT_449908 [Hebeloma cylindrosporum]|uniref:Uncharacterized protein n=1 Tax=Hebeloma cylindrosporum TaxID=76867 RepID=A0A0C3BE28_HEBCY|nr:hypothetical protein M413DRAFT_449908 [Hebeloma cylindrosporum h7]